MASSRDEKAEVPQQLPNVLSPDISQGAGHLRIIVDRLEDSIREIRTDIGNIKDHRHTDFKWYVTVFGGGFLILAGMFIIGYLRLDDHFMKTDDKLNAVTNSETRIDTKLEDLLQRIPPAQTPLPPARR